MASQSQSMPRPGAVYGIAQPCSMVMRLRVMSSSARSKKSASPDRPFARPAPIAASYAGLFLMAWLKIVGFEVYPVTDSSAI